jgi:vacuolar-type H+-ATPase subunit I/STV1
MVHEIKQWLASDQDFTAGVELYNRYGKSAVLRRMFANGSSSFVREKLLQSLQELAPVEVVDPKPAAAPKPRKAAVKKISQPEEKPVANPADQEKFEQLMQQRQSLLDERTLIHARLNQTPEGNPLLEASLRILELVPIIKKLNYTRKYYLEHGCLPAEKPAKAEVDESDMASLVQHRNNLRTKRSRLKDKPEKAEELEKLESEIERLTLLIKSK